MNEKFTLFESTHPVNAVYKNSKTKVKCAYIKKADMEKDFPAGGYSVVGQIGKGNEQIGVLSLDGKEEPVYKAQKVGMAKIAGFLEVEENKFLAVQKSTLPMVLLILLLVLLLCGLLCGLILKFMPEKPVEQEPTTVPSSIDTNAQPGLGELDLPEQVEDLPKKNIAITGIVQMNMKANQKEQNVILTNSIANKDVCFMTFTIYIDKNSNKKIDSEDEEIYKSDLVQPGYSISRFNLTRTLEAGEYDMLVLEQPYSFDKARTPLNNSVVVTKAVVK